MQNLTNQRHEALQNAAPLLTLALAAAVILLLYAAATTGLKKTEQAECLKWQDQAETLRTFTATDWQREQCAQYGLTLEPRDATLTAPR